jgi:hypothetical protein
MANVSASYEAWLISVERTRENVPSPNKKMAAEGWRVERHPGESEFQIGQCKEQVRIEDRVERA